MKRGKGKWKWGWRGWRRISQASFLLLFLYLAALAQAPRTFNQSVFEACAPGQDLRLSAPVTFFFDLDPLAALGTMLSTWSLKPTLLISLAVLLAALVMGRIFCGFICPFGALHQFCTWLDRRRKKSVRAVLNQPSPSARWKYFLLLFFLGAALLGSHQAGWLDPLSFFFRGLTLAVFPGLEHLAGLLSAWLADLPRPWSYLAYAGPYVFDPVLGYGFRAYRGALILGGLFLFVLALNLVRPRFFCRALCPLGALLGLFSRFGFFNLTKDKALCTDCGLCRVHCQGACGPHPDDEWLRPECFDCLNCQTVCPEGALRFRFQFNRPGPEPSPRPARDVPDLSRRAVLASLVGGAALTGLSRVSLASPLQPQPELIRPPGALAEADFLKRCLRCGLCMRACPTNVLQPALTEGGWEGVWTPYLNFSLGYCEYSCTLCSSVCPTGAIRLLTGREKTETPVSIGSAFFDRNRCLPWSGQGPCLVCEEHCPVSPKAIYLVPLEINLDKDRPAEVLAPQVNLTRCIGCGICAYKCPVKGRPAVYVNSLGETRSPANRILLPDRK